MGNLNCICGSIKAKGKEQHKMKPASPGDEGAALRSRKSKMATKADDVEPDETKNKSVHDESLQKDVDVQQHAEKLNQAKGSESNPEREASKNRKQEAKADVLNQNSISSQAIVHGDQKETKLSATNETKYEDSAAKKIENHKTPTERQAGSAKTPSNQEMPDSISKERMKMQQAQIDVSSQNMEPAQTVKSSESNLDEHQKGTTKTDEEVATEETKVEIFNKATLTETKPANDEGLSSKETKSGASNEATSTESKLAVPEIGKSSEKLADEPTEKTDSPSTNLEAEKSDSKETASSNAMVPHHVVTFTGDTPSFNIKAVTDMIASIKAEEKSVFVISITGVFRSGKSFFINLMKVYLDYYTQNNDSDDGWEEKEELEISGVNWARGQNAVTHGIWMWMYPSLVHGKAILFMDCQGTGDNQLSSSTLDNLIVYIGLQLADVQVLNIKGQLASTDLDRLSLCALYADSASMGSIFEKLIFLIRDWEDEEPPQQLPEMLEEMTSATTKRSVNGILKAFAKVEAVGLCHPGSGVSKKSEKDKVTIGNVDEEFLETAKKLFQDLFGTLPEKTRNTGETLNQQFMMLSARAVDHVSTPLEVLGESIVSRAFEETKEHYMEMLKKEVNISASNGDVRAKAIADVHQQAIKSFEEDSRVKEYADSDKLQEYIGHLQYMKGEIMSSIEYQIKLGECDLKMADKQEEMKSQQEEVDRVKEEYKSLREKIQERESKDKEKLETLEKEVKEKEEKEKQLFWQIDGFIQDKHKVVKEEAERHDKQTSYAIRWVLTKYVASRVAKIWEHQHNSAQI